MIKTLCNMDEVINKVGIKCYSNIFLLSVCTPWTQNVKWMYMRRSEDVQDVFWMSYLPSIYVVYLGVNYLFCISKLYKATVLPHSENTPFSDNGHNLIFILVFFILVSWCFTGSLCWLTQEISLLHLQELVSEAVTQRC